MNRLLLDLTHTSHTRAHTGVQRVCRSLHLALRQRQGDQSLPLCHDGYENTWRPLRAWERRNLAPPRGATAGARGSRWPLSAQLAGHLRRLLPGRPSPESPPAPLGGSLIEPEVFSAGVGRALPGRTNLVLTRSPTFAPADCVLVGSLDQARRSVDDGSALMVIGALR